MNRLTLLYIWGHSDLTGRCLTGLCLIRMFSLLPCSSIQSKSCTNLIEPPRRDHFQAKFFGGIIFFGPNQEVLGINSSHTGVMGEWGVWRLNKIFGGQFFLAQILILWICVVRFYVITLSIWPSEGQIVTRRIGNPFLENNIHIQVHIWNWKHPRSSHRDHLCLSFMFGGISEL